MTAPPPRLSEHMLAQLAGAIVAAAENAQLGVSVSLVEGTSINRVYVNDAAAKILGSPAEELVRTSTLLTFPPEELGRIEHMWEQWSSGHPVPKLLETVSLRKDGTRLPIEVAYCHVELDGKPATVAFLRDITERKKTEGALKKSEQIFRKLIEAAPEAVVVARNDRFVYANPHFLQILGYERIDDLPGHALELVHPDDRSAIPERERSLHEWPAQGLAPAAEYRLLTRRGEYIWVECSTLVIDFEGAPATLTFLRDITARKQTQAQLIQTDRMATIGTLVAAVTHELNNPLAYVLLNCTLLARELAVLPVDLDTRARLSGRIATLEEGAERMATIVRDLRNFCRPSSPLLAPIDVRYVLESAINMAMNELRDRARLVRDYAPVPPVMGDSAQLGQVFLNLLLNAAQALPEGHAADNEVRVTVGLDGRGQVVIEVADSGHGIAPEVRDRIFEPFFTTKPMSVGTGLGLPICRSIVSSMRGDITVESEVGRGSKFRVSLPVVASELLENATDGRASEPRSRPTQAKLLVVDDEALIASALVKVLELEHEVTSVTSGEQALQLLLRGATFDVILCDVSMPGTSGIDLYHTLQRFRPDLALRIIFMSGGASMPYIAEFLARVDNRHIDKPVDLALLRMLIRKTRTG